MLTLALRWWGAQRAGCGVDPHPRRGKSPFSQGITVLSSADMFLTHGISLASPRSPLCLQGGPFFLLVVAKIYF